jgi:hypothetical protein
MVLLLLETEIVYYYNTYQITHDNPPNKIYRYLIIVEIPIVFKNNKLHIFISKHVNITKDKTPKKIFIPILEKCIVHKFNISIKKRIIINICVSPQYNFLFIQKLTPVIVSNKYRNKYL